MRALFGWLNGVARRGCRSVSAARHVAPTGLADERLRCAWAWAWYEPLVSRVLVVDDEADVRFVLRRAFEGAGQDVIEAVHGADAVARIGEAKPDLIITDIMMPVMDGQQLIVWLRGRVETLGIPILALTGFRADHVGADDVVRKPFVPAQVRDVGLALLGREG